MVLCARLQLWFSPLREQAGCRTGRGCTDHIVTLHLLTDLARKKKLKLFITFVDFFQAYNKVPHFKLFAVFKRLGCGAVMLLSLIAMYKVTDSIVGTAMISATTGVHQGSPRLVFC